MKEIVEIYDITPFNDVYYKNCLYNPLLTGIYFCNGSIVPFLSNDFFTYDFNKDEQLMIGYVMCKPETELIEEMGIGISPLLDKLDYVKDIKNSIENNTPVFIPIDRYSWTDPIYNQGFNKNMHMAHFFLVYGYDDNKKEFMVIDVDDNGDGCYKNRIQYEELIDSYDGFCKCIETSGFLSDNKLRMFRLQKAVNFNKESYSTKVHEEIFKKNFINKKVCIREGLENLKRAREYYSENYFINYFKEISQLPFERRDTYISKIINPFFGIERAKIVQAYQAYKLFDLNNNIYQIPKKVLHHFMLLKNCILKMLYTQNYDKLILSINENLDQIYQLENDYLLEIDSMI